MKKNVTDTIIVFCVLKPSHAKQLCYKLRGALRLCSEMKNKARIHSQMLAESTLLNNYLLRDLLCATLPPHKSLIILSAKPRGNGLKMITYSKHMCFIFPMQCLSKKESH